MHDRRKRRVLPGEHLAAACQLEHGHEAARHRRPCPRPPHRRVAPHDRQASHESIGNPDIRRDLGLSVAQMGVLLSAFSWAYAVSQLPAGLLVEKVGPRRLLAGAILCWSVAQALAGFVTWFAPFIAARMALGVFEAPTAPTQARMVANWFERARRALPMGWSF